MKILAYFLSFIISFAIMILFWVNNYAVILSFWTLSVISLWYSLELMKNSELYENKQMFDAISKFLTEVTKDYNSNEDDLNFMYFIKLFNIKYELYRREPQNEKGKYSKISFDSLKIFKFIPEEDLNFINKLNIEKINLFETKYGKETPEAFEIFNDKTKEMLRTCCSANEFFLLDYLNYKISNNEKLNLEKLKTIESSDLFSSEILTEEQKLLIKSYWMSKKQSNQENLNKIYI